MTLEYLAEAEAAGARRTEACALLGLSVRTVERWKSGASEDLRQGPKTEPGNKLAKSERQEVLAALNSPEYRDLSPSQIVPALADTGVYLASESTMYRILREEDQLHHRERSKAPVRRPPREHVATGPEQVWSWDITYLRAPVQGMFFYLYLVVDVWSRKVVGWEVNEEESSELASALFERTCAVLNRDPKSLRLVVHSDNGGPMKGATLTATFASACSPRSAAHTSATTTLSRRPCSGPSSTGRSTRRAPLPALRRPASGSRPSSPGTTPPTCTARSDS